MKNRIFRHTVLLVLTLFLLISCDKDYLETIPESSVSPETVFETTDNAKFAVNGLARIMTSQHLSSQGFNGEGTIKMYYGNYPGENFGVNLPGWASVINGIYFDNNSSIYDYYPWHYYYKIIANANQILESIDGAEGPDSEKEYITAQALTYRAYSYFMLSQIYSVRWKDSNEGAAKGVVLRLLPDSEAMPLSTLGEVYDQVYDDLTVALGLFDSSGYERKKNYEIDASVAHAVFARAAITKEDYPNAADHAAKARASYPLMSVSEYHDGFFAPNQEWIWSSYDSTEETLYFYSYQAYIAYNSTASAVRLYPKYISKELYYQIPSSDIRRGLFLNPEGYDYNANNGAAGEDLEAEARSQFPELQSNADVYAYMQFKIAAEDMPGIGNVNHFRSSEMLLIEAEAKHFLNKNGEAQDLLEELTRDSGRDPSYTCTVTGEDLFDEIKKYRAIELWGEGFDWFDLKRWKDPISRKSWSNGGNFPNALATDIGPEDNNNWTWRIPLREKDNNDLID